MPTGDPDLIAHLAATWHRRRLARADAEGLAAALAPVEAAMAAADDRLGFEDLSPTRFAASLERHAPESADG
jgi:hypothetical protein